MRKKEQKLSRKQMVEDKLIFTKIWKDYYQSQGSIKTKDENRTSQNNSR